MKAIQTELGFEFVGTGTTKACIFDPKRHQAPEIHTEPTPLPGLRPELAEFIDRMNKSVALPRLSPAIYRRLFETIANALNQGLTEHFELLSAIERMCYERKLPVRREAINFVAAGLSQGGYKFAEGPHTADKIANAFFESTMDLCAAAQMQLSPEERSLFGEWLGTGNTDTTLSGGDNSSSPPPVDANENAPQSGAE